MIPPDKKVTMTFSELKNLMLEMARLGVQEYQKSINVKNDELKQREAWRWMQSHGLKPAILEKFVEEGVIRPRRKGTAKNSPKIYSLTEIQSAIITRENLHIFIRKENIC